MRELVDLLQTAILAGTAYLIAVRLAARLPTTLRLPDIVVRVEPPVGVEDEQAPAALPTPPEEVLKFCAGESEQFMREALLAEAHELYAGPCAQSWDAVLAALSTKYGGE